MKVDFELENPQKTLDRIFNDKVGIFTAETCGRYFNPFVPMRTGFLSQNYKTEPFQITYTSPYAKKMYEGIGYNFSKEQHTNAIAYWNEASMRKNQKQIAKEITKFIEKEV